MYEGSTYLGLQFLYAPVTVPLVAARYVDYLSEVC